MSATEGNGTLKRLLKFSLVVLLAAGVVAAAETPKDDTSSSSQDGAQVSAIISGGGISSLPENPVERVRTHQSWEYGPFVNGGWGLGNRDNFHFFSAGVEVGKVMTPVLHAGILSGQFQFAANLMPIWQAYTPAPHEQSFLYPCSTGTCYFVGPDGGGTYTGASFTPVILRWNFLNHSRRFQPWFQGAGGLIYTTHKFPPDLLVPHGTAGGTSVFNFSPQGGGGIHWFTSEKRSIDLGVNGVHISSASLGDRNPGVNASIQVQVGYTFWK